MVFPLLLDKRGAGIDDGVGGGAAASWQQQLLAQFPAGDDVGVWYNFVTASSLTTYWLYKHLYNNRYWRLQFGNANLSVGQNHGHLKQIDIADLYKGFNDQTTPALTENGVWSKLSNENYPGGRLAYKTSGGGYLEITRQGTTFGAVTVSSQPGYGVFLVSIDGDNTLADLLPTAQDLVTSGDLADTVLVANGGTLNPTDRVWDLYSLTPSNAEHGGNATYQLFTTSLSDANHTVRLTSTGYKNVSSSGVTVAVFEILTAGPSTRATDSGNDFPIQVQTTDYTNGNIWEVSYFYKPTGATNYAWLGHDNQAKISVVPAITVDGVDPSLTDEGHASGSEIVITQTCDIVHPDTGATVHGTYAITYTLNKSTGLTIAHTITWDNGGLIQGYPGMMALAASIFDRYKSYGNAEIDLTANDESVNLNSPEQLLWAWDLDGNQAAVMYIPDLTATVEDWAKTESTRQFYWVDTTGVSGNWNKGYARRYRTSGTINTFAATDVITSEIQYRVHWFIGGANAELAGKY